MRLGVSKSFRLVTNQVVPVGSARVELLLEKLRQEWGREVHGENLCASQTLFICYNSVNGVGYLVGRRGVFGKGQDSRNTDGQVETTNVIDLRIFNELPDLWRLEVLELVVVGSSQVGNQGTVVTGNHDTATSGGMLLVDSVFGAETLALAGLTELVGRCILTDTSDVDGRFGRKNVLQRTH